MSRRTFRLSPSLLFALLIGATLPLLSGCLAPCMKGPIPVGPHPTAGQRTFHSSSEDFHSGKFDSSNGQRYQETTQLPGFSASDSSSSDSKVRGQTSSTVANFPPVTPVGNNTPSAGSQQVSSPFPTLTVPVGQTGSTNTNNVINTTNATNTTGTTSGTDRVLPPTESEVPKIARNTYENSLENSSSSSNDSLTTRQINGRQVQVPARNRESLADRETEEKELREEYKTWNQKQKEKNSNDKTPRYLRPLNDDKKVFEDPSSPYARKPRNDANRKFVRQITASDLNLMSDYSSSKYELKDWEREEPLPIDWSKYSAKTLWQKWKDALGMGPDQQEAIALMKQACQKHAEYEETKDTKKLQEAAALYVKAGKKWPDSVLQEDALFYAGECRFFAGDYNKSLENYRELVTKYTNSILRKDAMQRLYLIGCYWVKVSEEEGSGLNLTDSSMPLLGPFAGAKKAFETIFMNDASDKGIAPDALYALAGAYMRRGSKQGDASYEAAARYYRQLYEFYPGCKYADDALQMAMLAYHNSYLGPLYDDKPLKDAKDIAEAAQRSGRGNKEVILEELNKVKEEQANHLWTRGIYYEKQGHYASARNYYNRLVKEYPHSVLVEDAARRYDSIRDKPAESDQFAWVRPVMPFLPKEDNVYYEEQPSQTIDQIAGRTDVPRENDPLQFSQLDNGKTMK